MDLDTSATYAIQKDFWGYFLYHPSSLGKNSFETHYNNVLNSIDIVLEQINSTRETGVQSQVKSYQRLKKWYLMLPCLALSIR